MSIEGTALISPDEYKTSCSNCRFAVQHAAGLDEPQKTNLYQFFSSVTPYYCYLWELADITDVKNFIKYLNTKGKPPSNCVKKDGFSQVGYPIE